MNIEQTLKIQTAAAVKALFDLDTELDKIIINETKKEFEGDFTVVVFPFVRAARKAPVQVGQMIGEYLQEAMAEVQSFNVIKGFLNIAFHDSQWLKVLDNIQKTVNYGQQAATNKKIVLEYCGPNTNKPLHLGHIRNMLIGYSMANILSANGHEVHKVNIYNDRGIAICKSMVAWQETGEGKTPASEGIKGDHFVGKFYVKYDQMLNAQANELVEAEGISQEDAKKIAPIALQAKEMLLKWEDNDADVKQMWAMMNGWVYDGFAVTYDLLGVDFEKDYKESDTYLLGKKMVQEGLDNGIFYTKDDHSTWVDLTDEKLDNKLLLRNDGTSVYITQDLGVADLRYQDYQMDQSIYVVGNEQDYHFQVLPATLEKLGKPYAAGIYHLSYGMMDLPSGKMKSREGTVVDADELITEMFETAEKYTKESGKIADLDAEEAHKLFKMLGLGALKYFILKVNPKKRMLFNPQESIDFLGNTGPFIQYSHARIQSILRKYKGTLPDSIELDSLAPLEKGLIIQQYKYPAIIVEAGIHYDPSVIASYAYGLAKTYNKFYAELPILSNENPKVNAFRVLLSLQTAKIIKSAMNLLGVDVPERM